jgi:uncharacterized protein (DUF2252 family)
MQGRGDMGCARWLAGTVLAAALCATAAPPLSAQRPLRPLLPLAASLKAVPPALVDRLRSDPFVYFRFINRAWTTRVCEVFADVSSPVIVRLHGDAHVEQFALTRDAWGLADFDDSARGPTFIDLVRFVGSIDLATRQLGWTADRDAVFDRFYAGYRRGLTSPAEPPVEPAVVRRLRLETPVTRRAYLEWGEQQMQPMDAARLQLVTAGVESVGRAVRRQRSDLAPGYFTVVRAGWLHVGVGSAAIRKFLVRVQGPTADPDDDVLIEAKEVANLDGVRCLEDPAAPQAGRVVAGARQLGRLKQEILVVEPTPLIPVGTGRPERWLEWVISSWEPSYREVHLTDLQSVDDLRELAFDAGVQLGAGKLPQSRSPALASVDRLERRQRAQAVALIDELLAGWHELRQR